MELHEAKFKPHSYPRAWESVLTINSFKNNDYFKIVDFWKEYFENLEGDLEDEYQRIRYHQLSKSNTISPLWENWASHRNTKVAIDFDYSSNLECQRNGMKDKDKRITDHKEQDFAGALMCCDTPWRTVAFLHEQFCLEQGVGFEELVRSKPELDKYVFMQFEAAFIGKNTLDFPRPSDYEVEVGIKKSLSLIPHPNHGSLPSGHSCVSQAVKKKLPEMFDITPSKAWLQLCDDCGIARVTMGIHWFADHQASIDSVEHHHEMINGYL